MLVDCFLYLWFRGLINLGGNTLREKLHDPVRLRYINWGAKERQQPPFGPPLFAPPQFGPPPSGPPPFDQPPS